jgi:hypothetical protein
MQNIHVKRYTSPNPDDENALLGWIEPEDASWLLFVNAKGQPSLYLLTESCENPAPLPDNLTEPPDPPERCYVNACGVFDAKGTEVKHITLQQLGLKVLGMKLQGPFVEEAVANPPELVVKAKQALDAALEEPATRWGAPYQGRVVD